MFQNEVMTIKSIGGTYLKEAVAGGWGTAGDIYHPEIQHPRVKRSLREAAYTCIHTYTYAHVTTKEYLVVKKYRLFYNNSTIVFYYNTVTLRYRLWWQKQEHLHFLSRFQRDEYALVGA